MNNNENNNFPINNGELIQNNQMQNINNPNIYPNGYGNNYSGNPEQLIKAAKKCKSLSIAMLCMYIIEIVCAIIGGVFLTRFLYNTINDSYIDDFYGNNVLTDSGDFHTYSMMLIPIIIVAIVIFVLGIVLTVKTHDFSKMYNGGDTLWILYLIGIFIGITGFIATFMTISACNVVERKYIKGNVVNNN